MGLTGKGKSEQNYWSLEVLGPVQAVHPVVSWLSSDGCSKIQIPDSVFPLNLFESTVVDRVCLDKRFVPKSRVIEYR